MFGSLKLYGKEKKKEENKKRPLSSPDKQPEPKKRVAFDLEKTVVYETDNSSEDEEEAGMKSKGYSADSEESDENKEDRESDIPTTVQQKLTETAKHTMEVVEAIDAIKETINTDNKIADSTKRVFNRQLKVILEAVNKLQLTNVADIAAREERAILQKFNIEAVAEMKKTAKKMATKERTQQPNYAEKLKLSTSKIPSRVPPISTPVILVYPPESEPQQTSDQTKEELKKAVKPIQKGLQIESLKKIGKGGVALRTSNQKDIRKLKKVLENEGLKTREPTKLKPNIIVYNVPNEIKKEDLNPLIRNQNYPEMTQVVFDENVKPAFGIKRKFGNTTSWVLEVSPNARIGMLQLGKLYIDFSACKVEDYLRIPRCYNCQQFGHITKKCENTKVCSICATEGHSHKECKVPESKAVCRNCKRFNRPHNHSVRSVGCPYYQRLIRERKEKTDYLDED